VTTHHTPGPWVAYRNSAFWEINPVNGGENGIPFSVGDVCASKPGFPDCGLQEANARLISAAPDLLEALETVLNAIVIGNDGDEQPVEDLLEAWIYTKAHTAIQKTKVLET